MPKDNVVLMTILVNVGAADVTPEQIAAAIDEKFGHASIRNQAHISVGYTGDIPGQGGPLGELWLYWPASDEDGAVVVDAPDETEGKAIGQEDMDWLLEYGVVSEFHAKYPRAERYGAPLYASDSDWAEAVVSTQMGFSVDAHGMTVYSEDTGDDSAERIWVKLMVSEQFAQRFA